MMNLIERRRARYARIPGEREEPWGPRAGRTREDSRSDLGHKSMSEFGFEACQGVRRPERTTLIGFELVVS